MTGNIDYVMKALTRRLYLRMMCIEPDKTRQFEGTKIDFVKPMLTRKIDRYPTYRVSIFTGKEAQPRNFRIF